MSSGTSSTASYDQGGERPGSWAFDSIDLAGMGEIVRTSEDDMFIPHEEQRRSESGELVAEHGSNEVEE